MNKNYTFKIYAQIFRGVKYFNFWNCCVNLFMVLITILLFKLISLKNSDIIITDSNVKIKSVIEEYKILKRASEKQ